MKRNSENSNEDNDKDRECNHTPSKPYENCVFEANNDMNENEDNESDIEEKCTNQ